MDRRLRLSARVRGLGVDVRRPDAFACDVRRDDGLAASDIPDWPRRRDAGFTLLVALGYQK